MFENLLTGKKILLGVSGSISIYKSLELIRLFIKSGAQVRVVMSESSKKFITPLTFETISMHKVLHQESECWESDLNHIKLGEWADLFVIAPASANTIAKLSQGIADNLLLQTALAYSRKKLLCPAANTNMINNPIIQKAMESLKLANYALMNTQTKLLACNTKGDGALVDIEEIYFEVARMLLQESFWMDRRAIVTAGGTIEKIDDVRYLSNFSSGKMGSSLALALYFKGAHVTMISTRSVQRLPISMMQIKVESSEQMHEFLGDAIRVAKKGHIKVSCDDSIAQTSSKPPFLFMAAAVSDYVPRQSSEGKLKKSQLGEAWSLDLTQNVDILKSIDKEGIKTIGFKAEMDEKVGLDNARNMRLAKSLDAVCYNLLSEAQGFGSDNNSIVFIDEHQQTALKLQDKLSLSMEILKLCESV